VDHEQKLVSDFTDQLGFFGYTVELVHSATDIRKFLERYKQQILVINTNILDAYENTARILRAIKEEYDPFLSIFLSQKRTISIQGSWLCVQGAMPSSWFPSILQVDRQNRRANQSEGYGPVPHSYCR
jgi:hypothetical protein